MGVEAVQSLREGGALSFCQAAGTADAAFDHIGLVGMQGKGGNICFSIELLSNLACYQTHVFDLPRTCGVQWLSSDVFEGLMVAGDGTGDGGMPDQRWYYLPG